MNDSDNGTIQAAETLRSPERGMVLPSFLKYAYLAIAAGCLTWFLLSSGAAAPTTPVTSTSAGSGSAAGVAASGPYLSALAGAVAFAVAAVTLAVRRAYARR
jgi:hypothetical protein